MTLRGALRRQEDLYQKYQEPSIRTKATIDADHILRRLAALVVAVNQDASQQSGGLASVLSEETIQNSLLGKGYQATLSRLSHLSLDYANLDRYYNDALEWMGAKGVFAAAAVPCLLVLSARFTLGLVWIPLWLLWSLFALLIFYVACAAGCWYAETKVREFLVLLFRTYDH